jgi:hypothetical protein
VNSRLNTLYEQGIDPNSIWYFNEAWRPYVEDKTDTPPKTATGGCFLNLFTVMFLGFGLLAMGAALAEQFTRRQLNMTGIIATATITRLDIETDDEGTSYSVTYQYVVSDQVYTSSTSLTREFYNILSVGQPIEIRYLPNEPATSRLTIVVANVEWLPFVLGAAFVLIGGGVNFLVGQADKDQKALRATGQLVVGEITNFSISRDSDNDLVVKYDYRLRRPDGTIFSSKPGRNSETRNDLANHPKPTPGTRVVGLYLSDKNHLIL